MKKLYFVSICLVFAAILTLILGCFSLCWGDSFSEEDYAKFQKEDLERQEIIDSKPIVSLDGNVISDNISALPQSSPLKAAAKGSYPHNKGVYLYTKDTVHKIAGVVGHASIIYNTTQIIEATSDGVSYGKNNWDKKSHCRAGFIPVLSQTAMNKTANKARSWLGLPYNWHFTNTATRKMFYCSQLVWAAYKDVTGFNLNSGNDIVFPSELMSSKHTSIIYSKG